MGDPYNLQRFVDAQDPVFDQVCLELRNGRKSSHWMWFIFPQIHGLGWSSTSQLFAISSLAEAEAYLKHHCLGTRLRECTALTLAIDNSTAQKIFGAPDYWKFRSSMTLFAHTNSGDRIFHDALQKFYDGEPDPLTLQQLKQAPPQR